MIFSADFLHGIWLKQAQLSSLSNREWEALVLLLRSEMLLARFAYWYEDESEGFPAFVQAHLGNAKTLATRQAKQVEIEARMLVPLCSQFSQHILFLKGAAYTLLGGQLAKGRVYSDIDILVDKDALLSIEKRLGFKGWIAKPVNNYDEAYYRKWMHEIPPLIHSNRGTVLDIHHNIVPPVSGKAPPSAILTEHTMQSQGGFETLSPAALVLHSSVHLFFNEDQDKGYRDLIDIWLLIQRFDSQEFWTELVRLTDCVGFKTDVILALYFVSQFFDVGVPKALQPNTLPKAKWWLLKNIYSKTVLPSHPYMQCKYQGIAITLAWARGHWCKMPIPILLYHFLVKGSRKLIEKLFGDHVFKNSQSGS